MKMQFIPVRQRYLTIATSACLFATPVMADHYSMEIVEVQGQTIPTAGLGLSNTRSVNDRRGEWNVHPAACRVKCLAYR
ncbi:Uncharacterised protein [Halioglobus japonicus]|nr:Uncharacterised protein [Halioglobus japonicus]